MNDRQHETMTAESNGRRDWIAVVAAAVIFSGVFAAGARWTGVDGESALLLAVLDAATALPMAALWLAAAAGLGELARQVMRDRLPLDGMVQLATGIALLLLMDVTLGSLGLLQFGGTSIVAWVVTLGCIAPLLWTVRRWRGRPVRLHAAMPWLWPAMAVPTAVLMLAGCSAPGWLWSSEFGGYDAMSYHLQLPKQWLAAGAIQPVTHNVYSFLPSWMESAYYHLMVLHGDGLSAVIACQLLHAALAVIAACAAARLCRAVLGQAMHSRATVLCGAIVLGTPWLVVVGSLAYNEMPVVLMFAAALVVIVDCRGAAAARGAVIGVLVGAAVGAKASSIGLVALPAALAMTWMDRQRLWALTGAAAAGAVTLLPWLVRNAHTGNPVFPLLAELLGSAHWTAEQVDIWNAAHHVDLSTPARIGEAWRQLMTYGMGANPDGSGHEPWQPLWSVLPWLGAAGAMLATTAARLRRPAMMLLAVMVVQVLFWLLFTHIKSRFMLPMIVPAACAAALGAYRLELLLRVNEGRTHSAATVMIAGLALLWCAQPLLIFRGQRDGAPAAQIGWVDRLAGRHIAAASLDRYAAALPTVYVNTQLPGDAKVLLVGDAAPLYYEADIAYATVWDRGAMSAVIAAEPNRMDRWVDSLRERGFTHVLLSPTMLDVWQRSGWRDAALDPAHLATAFDAHSRVAARFLNGSTLYDLTPTE